MPAFWPGDTRMAVTISLMCESGGQVRPDSRALGPLGPQPMPLEYPDLPTETWFDYGIREAIPRLLDVYDRHGVPVTAFVVGQVAERYPELIAEIAQRGHECAGHGYQWVPQYAFSEEEEREFIRKTVSTIEAATKTKPVGWNCHALRRSVRTLDLLAEQGFFYHIDDVSRDEPFVSEVAGKPFVTVPYSLHLNDLHIYEFSSGTTEMWFEILKSEFDAVYAESAHRRMMMPIPGHDRVIGRPGRAAALDRLLTYIQGHEGVWFARRDEIARFMLDEAT